MWWLDLNVFFKNRGSCELLRTSCLLDCDGKVYGKEHNKQHLDSWYTSVSNIVCMCCYLLQNMPHLKKTIFHIFFLWITGPVIWKFSAMLYTVDLHLTGLTGMVSHPDMQKIRIIGFFS